MANTQGNEIEQTAVNTQLPPAARTKPDQDFIHHEPPMRYELPKQPVPEAGPVLVTPLERVPGARAVNVDCPYCRKVVKTEVREVDADDDGMVKCLICLVCWPALFCYEGNKHTNHHCSNCKKQLTHQPSGNGVVQVVANTNPQPNLVPSKYEQSS